MDGQVMSLLSGFSNFHIVCIILDVRLCKPAEFQYAWHVAAVKTDIIPGQNSPLLSGGKGFQLSKVIQDQAVRTHGLFVKFPYLLFL